MSISISNRDDKTFIISNRENPTMSKVVVTTPLSINCYHFEPLTTAEETAIKSYLKQSKPGAQLYMINLEKIESIKIKQPQCNS